MRLGTRELAVALALVGAGCTGQTESAERFRLARVDWDLGDGAMANGTTLTVRASVAFGLDETAPPTGRDERCGLKDGDVVVRALPAALGDTGVAAMDVGEPAIATVLGEQECVASVEVVLASRAPGLATLQLSWRNREHSEAALEVRQAEGLFASLEGQQRLALVAGPRALLVVTRADADGRPLRGEPLLVSADPAAAGVEPVGVADAWWVTALRPGPLRIDVAGAADGAGLDVEALAWEQLLELRFFRLTVDPPCCGVLWRPVRWGGAPDFSAQPPRRQVAEVPILEPLTLAAAAVDASGEPVWVGSNRLAYTVPQFPVVGVAGADMHWGVVSSSGEVEVHGLEWLTVTPLRPGLAELSASVGLLRGALELTVR